MALRMGLKNIGAVERVIWRRDMVNAVDVVRFRSSYYLVFVGIYTGPQPMRISLFHITYMHASYLLVIALCLLYIISCLIFS